MVLQMLTQRPLIAWFRKQSVAPAVKTGVSETVTGLQEGARNMIGIAIACGTAGLIVGDITLTGLGLRMTAFGELVSSEGHTSELQSLMRNSLAVLCLQKK